MPQALQRLNPAPRTADDEEMRFLRRVVAVPGILSGTDLVSGGSYRCVVPVDVESFLAAHVLGPARVAEAPEVDVMMSDGECRRVHTFVRATVLPSGADGLTTHVAVRFKTSNSLKPSEAIIAASLALHRVCIKHYVERSVLSGVWVIWIIFDQAVDHAHAESLSRRVREVLRGIGIIEGDYTIPLLHDDPTPLHLPCMFFSGGFFGCLFRVDDEGNLREIERVSSSALNTGTTDPSSVHPVADGWLDGLLERWFEQHGRKGVRAGELVRYARSHGLLPPDLAAVKPQAAAVEMGRRLQALTEAGSGDVRIVAKKSGHSNIFHIEVQALRNEQIAVGMP